MSSYIDRISNSFSGTTDEPREYQDCLACRIIGGTFFSGVGLNLLRYVKPAQCIKNKVYLCTAATIFIGIGTYRFITPLKPLKKINLKEENSE